jgi:hypothetical protein
MEQETPKTFFWVLAHIDDLLKNCTNLDEIRERYRLEESSYAFLHNLCTIKQRIAQVSLLTQQLEELEETILSCKNDSDSRVQQLEEDAKNARSEMVIMLENLQAQYDSNLERSKRFEEAVGNALKNNGSPDMMDYIGRIASVVFQEQGDLGIVTQAIDGYLANERQNNMIPLQQEFNKLLANPGGDMGEVSKVVQEVAFLAYGDEPTALRIRDDLVIKTVRPFRDMTGMLSSMSSAETKTPEEFDAWFSRLNDVIKDIYVYSYPTTESPEVSTMRFSQKLGQMIQRRIDLAVEGVCPQSIIDDLDRYERERKKPKKSQPMELEYVQPHAPSSLGGATTSATSASTIFCFQVSTIFDQVHPGWQDVSNRYGGGMSLKDVIHRGVLMSIGQKLYVSYVLVATLCNMYNTEGKVVTFINSDTTFFTDDVSTVVFAEDDDVTTATSFDQFVAMMENCFLHVMDILLDGMFSHWCERATEEQIQQLMTFMLHGKFVVDEIVRDALFYRNLVKVGFEDILQQRPDVKLTLQEMAKAIVRLEENV